MSKNCAKWNISILIYVECDKLYRSKVCVHEFSYFLSCLDIQLEKSAYDSPVRKKIGCRWRNTTIHNRFFRKLIRANGLVVKVSRVSLVTWVQFLMSAENSAVPRPFCVVLSPSVHWHASFLYCCALYNLFFLDFVSGDLALTVCDKVVNLNTTIQLPLFWRTWTRALASTRLHVRAWHMGRY